MSLMTRCTRCKEPVVAHRVTMGHVVLFDPGKVRGGRWALGVDGVMRRYGRYATGYQPHARRCR
jgi:hypothetical protein